MRYKNKTKKTLENAVPEPVAREREARAPDESRPSEVSQDHLQALEIVKDLTRALGNVRRYLKDHKANINFEGLDAAIARGEAALKNRP